MTRPFNPRWRIRSDRFAALAVALAPLVYFLPALLRGKVLCPDDGIFFNVPLRVATAQIVRSGNLPLWNPYIFSGMPLLGAAQSGLFFPPNWFYLLFSPAVATNLMVVSIYVIAALGAFVYARRIGASVAGAMITSLIWQMSGFLVGQISHINIVHTAAMLPWILWALESYAGDPGYKGYKRGALLAVLVALQVFAGHPQSFVYSQMLVAAYAITMAVADAQLRKRYLSSLIFVASGVLLSALQIVPTFEVLRNSPRAEATYAFFTSFSMPRRFALVFFAPYLMGGGDGRIFRAPYIGPPFYPEMVGYVSLLAIMLALVAVLIKPDTRTKFWAVVSVVCMLLAFGGYAPLQLYRVIYYVPVLNLFRVPARHLMEVNLALAVLAGRGLTLLAAERGRRRVLGRVAAAGAFVFVVTVLAVTWMRPAAFHLGREAAVTVIRAPELFVPVLIAGLSVWALWLFARQRRGSAILLFAVLIVDLVVWGQASGYSGWYSASPKNGGEYWGVPETVQLLRGIAPTAPGSYRILTVPHTFNPAVAPVPPAVSHSTDWVLWTQPDIYMMHGIQNAAGYDGFGLERYNQLAGRMKVWGELTDPDLTLRGASREIDLLNARYLLSMRKQTGVDGSSAFSAATTQFGGFKFAPNDLGLPNLGRRNRLSFAVTPVEIDHVALLTSIGWSETVPNQTIVGRMRVRVADGRVFEFVLRAGADTAEWSYDRTDISARILHQRPTVATSYDVSDFRGNYQGHTYVTSFALPAKLEVTGGEIVLEPDSRWPDLSLSIFRVSLVNSGEVRTYPLSREWIRVESTSTPNEAPQPAEARSDRWKHVAQTEYVDIYENARALPRVWLASEARMTGEDATLDTIRTGKLPDGSIWDPLRTALTETEPAEPLTMTAKDGHAEITRYEPNRVELKAGSSGSSMLVLSENHYPGWRAYVDGRAVDTYRVDYNLRGVALGPGEHRVEFVYRPKSLLVGLVLSALTAIGLALPGAFPKRFFGGSAV